MHTVTFVGGPYDGAAFTFSGRLPDFVDLAVDCLEGDPKDTKLQQALQANLLGDELDDVIIMRNAKSITAQYKVEFDMDDAPCFRYTGWRLNGASAGETDKEKTSD